MDADLVKLILKDFGAAGGLAVLLLIGSVWCNWKQILHSNKQQNSISEIEKDHIKALSECKIDCEHEKLLYRETVDRRYQEAVTTFLQRDGDNRKDLDRMFTRFENLIGVVSDGLTKVTQSNQNLRYELKGERRGS